MTSYFPETRLIALIIFTSFNSLPAESHISFSIIMPEISVALLHALSIIHMKEHKDLHHSARLSAREGECYGTGGELLCILES